MDEPASVQQWETLTKNSEETNKNVSVKKDAAKKVTCQSKHKVN